MKKHKIYEGMAYFAKSCGVSIDIVKAAKSAGCPAFLPGNRVDSKKFFDWLSANPSFGKAAETAPLKDQKLSEEIRKLRIANDAKERLTVQRSAVCASISQTLNSVKALLEAKLENEYPASVAGLDIAGARVKGKQLSDSIITEFKKMGLLWEI